MMMKSLVDMSRPHMLYSAGLGFLMLASLAVSNISALSLSNYLEIPLRRELCAVLFIVGASMGAFAMQRHLQRAKTPWKVPQSQVSIPYMAFVAATFFGLLLAR